MNEEIKPENLRIHSRADELIACLEGEIAKRDEELAACRVAVENCEMFRAPIDELEDDLKCAHSMLAEVSKAGMALRSELSAIKAQEPVAWVGTIEDGVPLLVVEPQNWKATPLYAAPVSESKAQGEYGDAYQGAREDLAIWKRRALEAEEKVLQQEQIIDHLTSEAQGESRFGEPVVTPDAPCVPDGYVLADKKALGTVLQALVNAPHHIRELQATRQPVELFSDNPINVLIANYEAPAAPAAPAADAYSWRRKEGVNGIKEFMAQKCYDAQTDAIKKYYEPFKCANCKAADAGLVEALEHARLFIVNGIDLGFIQMPEADTPDPAHETLPMIDAALAAHRTQGAV